MSTMTASQYYASIKKDRDKWRDEQFQECMACNSTDRLQTHEITRRSAAPKRW